MGLFRFSHHFSVFFLLSSSSSSSRVSEPIDFLLFPSFLYDSNDLTNLPPSPPPQLLRARERVKRKGEFACLLAVVSCVSHPFTFSLFLFLFHKFLRAIFLTLLHILLLLLRCFAAVAAVPYVGERVLESGIRDTTRHATNA